MHSVRTFVCCHGSGMLMSWNLFQCSVINQIFCTYIELKIVQILIRIWKDTRNLLYWLCGCLIWENKRQYKLYHDTIAGVINNRVCHGTGAHSTASRDTGPFVFAATLDVWVQLLVSAQDNQNNKYIPSPCSEALSLQMLLWSSGKGQTRICKGWPLRRKALKLKPLHKAYIKVGCHHPPPPTPASASLILLN